MSHIYVTTNGTKVGIEGGRLKITKKDGMETSIPKNTVESISLFGNSAITTQCIRFLLENSIPVFYFSSKGKYFGSLESTSKNDIEIVKKQIETFDDEKFSMGLSKKIIYAKINNQNILMRRYIKEFTEDLMRNDNMMKIYKNKVLEAESINEIMGFEGIAARTYFDSISKVIEPEFEFRGRNKRPPRDKFNSLLSLGYTLLMYEIYPKVKNHGLTPYYSAMHKGRGDNPVLVSDMIEEWRSVIVDSVVLSMIQGHEIHAEHFYQNEDDIGVYLTNDGMRKFINKFERKMNSTSKYLQYDEQTYSMRNALNMQCKKMKECIIKGDYKIYKPIYIK